MAHPGSGSMRRRRLVVERKGFGVPATTFQRDGVTVRRDPYRVPPTRFTIEDRGAPGRGEAVIPPLKKGIMTKAAVEGRYIRQGQKVTDIPLHRMDDFGRYLARRYGAKRALGMLQAQVVFRRRDPEAARKFVIARDAIASAFGEQLKPREAIRASLRGGRNPYGPG